MEKKCFKCGKIKDLSAFYKHKEMADGLLGKCKECTKRYVAEYRSENIEKIREYDRLRSKLPRRKRSSAKMRKKYRKEHPLRSAVSSILQRAVKAKKIIKPKRCSMCNRKTKIVGHHEDYYKPLDVVWVCQVCHKNLHKMERIVESANETNKTLSLVPVERASLEPSLGSHEGEPRPKNED